MKIISPITGKSHSVKSKAGRQILKKYIQSYLNPVQDKRTFTKGKTNTYFML